MEQIRSSRRAPFGANPTVGEAGRATQRRILAAAADAFAETGYARTSVEAITDRAGCSRPTFYQYFSGKEDLHRRLAGRFGAELSDAIGHLDTVTADATGRQVLLHWIEALTDIYARHRAVALTFSASLRTDERMVSGASELSNEYRRALALALQPDGMAVADINALAGAVNVMAYGACLYREFVGEVDAERLAAALADTVHRTFFGPIPAVNMAPRVAATSPEPTSRRAATPAPPPENRRQRGLQTRQRLLDAARFAYGTLGFDAVRVDDIATEAGTSHGTFYRYFADKEAVFDELAGAAAADLDLLLAELPPRSGEAPQWAESYYRYYASHGAIVSCFRDARAAGVGSAIRVRDDMTAALSAALGTRDFGDSDADVVACFSLLENVPASAYDYSGLSIDDAVAATAAIIATGIFADRSPG